MVSSSYRITEPHPSVPASHYIHAGRGGAGNVSHVDPQRLTAGADAQGPASRTVLKQSKQPYYPSGRGGAGNMTFTDSERPIFSFDEELERQRRMMERQAPVYHVGRGGAGNFASESSKQRTSSTSSSDSSSDKAGRTSIEGVFNRIRGSFASSK
jgi:hypothetical protein